MAEAPSRGESVEAEGARGDLPARDCGAIGAGRPVGGVRAGFWTGAAPIRGGWRRKACRAGKGAGDGGMLTLSPMVKVFVCIEPTDMRKGYDGLSAMAVEVVKQNPLSGHYFV